MKKRVVSCFIITLIIVNMFLPMIALAKPNDVDLYQGISDQIPFSMIEDELPYGIPVYNSKGFKLNTEMWSDKHIIVYGDYTMVNNGSANIKYYHEDDPNDTESYYFRDSSGRKCEYRYLGFTFEGNKFPNPKFPADFRTNTLPENITWYKNPWELKKHYMNRISYANDKSITMDNFGFEKISYIQNSIEWNISKAIDSKTKRKLSYIELNLLSNHNFLNVDSPPSAHFPGRGRMINHSFSKNKDYYWTFSIPPVKGKNQTPVEATCTILNKNELNFGTGMNTVIAEVEVTGKLLDNEFYDNVSDGVYSGAEVDAYERSVNFCREDIENWDITLNTPGGESLNVISRSNNGYNGVKNTFYVELSRDFIDSGEVEFHASLFINYFIKKKSDTANAVDSCIVTEGAAILSQFTANETIMLYKDSEYKNNMLNYRDSSVGDITNYEWVIEDCATDETYSFSYPVAINENVNKFFYNSTRQMVSSCRDLIDDNSYFDCYFNVKQIVTDKYGRASAFSKVIKITVSNKEKNKVFVAANCKLPDNAIDIVNYKPIDNTDLTNLKSVNVMVDGSEVSYDLFFSGQYKFSNEIGMLGRNGRFVEVKITYTSVDDLCSEWIEWVYVYSSKPFVQYNYSGTLKENRRIDINNTSDSANPKYVTDRYPLNYEWEYEIIDGSDNSLCMRAGYDQNDSVKTMLFKSTGLYRFTLKGNNGLRDSDPYYIDLPISKDYDPAVIFSIWSTSMIRGDSLQMTYEGVSLEEDIITSQSFKFLYDSNNDGDYETEVAKYDDIAAFNDFIPTELGNYRLIYEVHEDFGQDTLSEFITDDDKKYTIESRDFMVENLCPMTKMYVDIPLNFPQTDIYILADPNLASNMVNELKTERVNYVNDLRRNSITPEIQVWDLHTYVYNQNVTRAKNTGSSYPSSSYYYNSNGYSGSLARKNVVDNGSNVDKGKYITVPDSKFVSQSATNSSFYSKYKYSGSWQWVGSGGSNLASSISYNDGNYSGTIYKNGSNTYLAGKSPSSLPSNAEDGDTCKQFSIWKTTYDGTVHGTKKEWQENWVWVSDYTGYYGGTVSKHVKQGFNNIFRDKSYKYAVYITDGSIAGKNDLDTVISKSDTKLIYSSPLSNKEDIEYDYYIENTGDTDLVIKEAIEIIKNENPYDFMYTLLLNENLNVRFADIDAENDPITLYEYQVVHEPNVFDNNTGLAIFANENYDESNYSNIDTSNINLNFNKKGKYAIYRRIKDTPVNHNEMAEFSNEPKLEVLIHEKPIADYDFVCTYNFVEKTYNTMWLDKSYDPDFEFSREDKGIINRKLRFKKNNGEWIYKIPEKLGLGNYTIEYIVQDTFGVWSEPKLESFTLEEKPVYPIDYTVNYICNGKVFFSETTTEYIAEPSKTIVLIAKQFTPLYELNDHLSKSITLSYDNCSQEVNFNYTKLETTSINSQVHISGNKLREDNTIASGYGVHVELSVNLTTSYDNSLITGYPSAYLRWLEDIEYEWTFNDKYRISNIYDLQFKEGVLNSFVLELCENKDSVINAKKIYTPVELQNGTYTGTIYFSGLVVPTYTIDDNGNVVRGEDKELTFEVEVEVNIRGSMYDDINIVS